LLLYLWYLIRPLKAKGKDIRKIIVNLWKYQSQLKRHQKQAAATGYYVHFIICFVVVAAVKKA